MQVPVNLLRCSRIFTFEPPPGVKASLSRTFGTVPAARMAKVLDQLLQQAQQNILCKNVIRSRRKELGCTSCWPGSMHWCRRDYAMHHWDGQRSMNLMNLI